MPEQDQYQLVLCTCPDEDSAQLIAEQLVDNNLAACVNILPGIISVYRWLGSRERAQEHLLIIKSTSQVYSKLEETIRELHPYELPEVIAVPIENGNSDYLSWISDNINTIPG